MYLKHPLNVEVGSCIIKMGLATLPRVFVKNLLLRDCDPINYIFEIILPRKCGGFRVDKTRNQFIGVAHFDTQKYLTFIKYLALHFSHYPLLIYYLPGVLIRRNTVKENGW